MIDIKLIRENKDLVKENIKKKFQDEKLKIVDEVYDMDKKVREVQTKCDTLKADKNKKSGEIGLLMKDKKIDEANKVKEEVAKMAYRCEVINPQVEPAPQELQDKHYYRKHGANAYYGQK